MKGQTAASDQQKCLDIFRNALWTSRDDLASIQAVKGHLYHRQFAEAFSKPEYLRAYALRWSASRSLAYAEIFDEVISHLDREPRQVMSIGGGAGAELVGFAAWKRSHSGTLSVQLVDIAEWADVIAKLYTNITTPPTLSKYASAAAVSRNSVFLSAEDFKTAFSLNNVLEDTMEFQQYDLVTLMFTLNELYATSMAKTQQVLKRVNAMKTGSLLLVVDSPGSYSTITLNGADKRYPMHWLLDHTMLGNGKEEPLWQKVISQESKWFRLQPGLEYPTDLENMRYQIHLYKRLAR